MTHANPVYEVEGIIYYCVTDMSGGEAKTSTPALTNETLPYIAEIENPGWRQVFLEKKEIRYGASVTQSHITHRGVAEEFDLAYTLVELVIESGSWLPYK